MSKYKAENSRILKKIIALMERNKKNGATKYEAETALKMANRLMAKYDITELDLKKVDRSSFTDKPFKMTRLAVLNLLTELAKAFDCEHYYYRAVKEFHFFGFEIDVKMCLYFANMLQAILESDIKNYKKSDKYKELVSIYQPKIIIRSFINGFYYSLAKRFKEMKEEKQIISSGTSLIVVKKQQVQDEFQQRFMLRFQTRLSSVSYRIF